MWKLNSILNSTEKMWKLQAITSPKVRTRESLPTPPKGMDWEQDEKTLQWKLIPISAKNKKNNNNTNSSSRTANNNGVSKNNNNNSNSHLKEPPRCRASSISSASSITSRTSTTHQKVVLDGLPIVALAAATATSSQEEVKMDDDEWDMLSEKISLSNGGTVVITTTGSVRSFNSLSENLSNSIPLRRTPSSSTIDSTDGDYALELLGVDYIEHIVLPSDTLQGICLAYKISQTRLRQANHFSGNSLTSAPRKLIVPLSKKAIRSGFVRVQDQGTTEYKIHAFLEKVLHIRKEDEAKEYLEGTDWKLAEAVLTAQEDGDWDKDCVADDSMKSSIHINVKLQPGESEHSTFEEGQVQPSSMAAKPITYEGLPAIATKNVRPQDVYNAAPQHSGYGVELQSFSSSKKTTTN